MLAMSNVGLSRVATQGRSSFRLSVGAEARVRLGQRSRPHSHQDPPEGGRVPCRVTERAGRAAGSFKLNPSLSLITSRRFGRRLAPARGRARLDPVPPTLPDMATTEDPRETTATDQWREQLYEAV